jgi:hypothetical protein
MGHKNYYQNSFPNSNEYNPNVTDNSKNHNNFYITFTKRRTRLTQTTTSTTTTTSTAPLTLEEYEITTEIPTTTITPQVLWWSRFNYLD